MTRLICVEGWSAIGKWTGVRLSEFLKRIGADTRAKYVWFQCAEGYSNPIDMATALHPQTQLTFKFDDEILPRKYGFPIKCRMPTKLGFKNPKYIIAMHVTDKDLGGYWEANLGYWDNRSNGRTADELFDIGFTPVFRLQQNSITGLSPYAELGVGIHFLSRTSVSTQRQFGSSFQFGDHYGAGVRFGDRGRYDIGYRYQHLSNAGIKQPNQGINFHQLRLQYHF